MSQRRGSALQLLALAVLVAGVASRTLRAEPARPWLDASLPLEARVETLLGAMTPQQKAAQLQTDPGGALPELGVPPFAWQAECNHGVKVGAAGTSRPAGTWGAGTIYPQGLAMAATFNDALIGQAAEQISDELRAHYNLAAAQGQPPVFTHCLSPHVGLVRDPRWGRAVETMGEDPLLQARMVSAFVRGLKGPPSSGYVKVGATCKHFLGHILEGRWGDTRITNFDARLEERDLRDSFLPPFQACAAEAAAVMCSYNSFQGLPSCTNPALLTSLLRGTLGFHGFVVTDKGALDVAAAGGFAGGSARRAAAAAVQAGVDAIMKNSSALDPADLAPGELDAAAARVLAARFRMGHFDPPERLPWASLNASAIGAAEHAATARQIAAEGTVLLKNAEGTLPLRLGALRTLAVIGPFADQTEYILGTYIGAASGEVATPLAALRAALPGVDVTFDASTASEYSEAHAAADAACCKAADACVLFLGSRLSKMRPEDYAEMPEAAYLTPDEGEGRDRRTLRLQPNQDKLWRAVAAAARRPLVVVLFHGGPLDVSDMEASPRVGAILSAGMPGQHGALAVADILLGRVSPSGRVPVTWHRESDLEQVHPLDQRMRAAGDFSGRTYRYWQGEAPLYPFGHGLSYASWQLGNASVAAAAGAGATAAITVTHAGSGQELGAGGEGGSSSGGSGGSGGMAADTSVLLLMSYAGPAGGSSDGAISTYRASSPELPTAVLRGSGCSRAAARTDLVQQLVGFGRTGMLQPGASRRLDFELRLAADSGGAQSSWLGFGDPSPPCGLYVLRFGADQPPAAALVLE